MFSLCLAFHSDSVAELGDLNGSQQTVVAGVAKSDVEDRRKKTVTGATPGVLPRRHLRRPVQPRHEISISTCEISEQIEGVILGNFFIEDSTFPNSEKSVIVLELDLEEPGENPVYHTVEAIFRRRRRWICNLQERNFRRTVRMELEAHRRACGNFL
ncbi:hypothetical protein U1Q18_048444 [Sarracenia purpurea var. burkii]